MDVSRPKREPRVFECKECKGAPACPMIKDEIWFDQLGLGARDLLCTMCFEDKLHRPIDPEDLMPCIANDQLIYFAARYVTDHTALARYAFYDRAIRGGRPKIWPVESVDP